MPLVFSRRRCRWTGASSATATPEQFLRPRDQVFNMNWQPPDDQLEEGRKLVEKYEVKTGS